MLTEQVERRVWGESMVEPINEPLDMSQQVEDGGGFDEECNAMQVSRVMHCDSLNAPKENLHQSHPTSEAIETRSDEELRCICIMHNPLGFFSHHYRQQHHRLYLMQH